jgi:integrase
MWFAYLALTQETRMRITQAVYDEPLPIEPGKDRVFAWDDALKGFGVVHMRSGAKAFVIQYRANGKSRRQHLKETSEPKARRLARATLGDVEKGRVLGTVIDPVGDLREQRRKEREEKAAKKAAQAATDRTLAVVATEYMTLGTVDRNGQRLRTVADRQGILDRAILPVLGDRPVVEIKKSEIVTLMDTIRAERGPGAERKAFTLLSTIFNWEARRSDTFRSPIVRGMAPPTPDPDKRVLNPEELRAVWNAADTLGQYGKLVQFLLLTATRRDETRLMTWNEVSFLKTQPDGTKYNGHVWTIPRDRYKTKIDVMIPLSTKARKLLDSIKRVDGSDLVFTKSGLGMAWVHGKRDLDRASGVTGWRLHDLRRTARTILSRTVRDKNGKIDPNKNVDVDTAERMLGHVIGGVRGAYDRYEYLSEKRAGFEILAKRITEIVND